MPKFLYAKSKHSFTQWLQPITIQNCVVFLIHWGRVTHICISNLTVIGWDNCLLPGLGQAIISINAGILLIQSLGTNVSEILSTIRRFSLKKMHLKLLSAKWRPFSLGLNVLSSIVPKSSLRWHTDLITAYIYYERIVIQHQIITCTNAD